MLRMHLANTNVLTIEITLYLVSRQFRGVTLEIF